MFVKTSALKVFLILGCNIQWLQQDRVSAALEYWDTIQINTEQSIWYLSGGVKNDLETRTRTTEAERMKDSLKSKNMNIVLDTDATNTAENFRNFFKFTSKLGSSSNLEIVIVTSRFHKARAEKFFYGFFPQSLVPQWVLAPGECPTCVQDELYHMRNVQADISKARASSLELLEIPAI